MIKLDGTKRTIRETTADFEYNDGDELKTEAVRVRYYSPTIADLRRLQDEIRSKSAEEGADGFEFWLSRTLADRLHSLPDIADEKGKPLEITQELLETFSIRNLESFRRAIDEDLLPKKTPGVP